jgi:predicted TIM-barrel fold metal-dependent hydrolase
MDKKGVAQSWLLTWEELQPEVPSLHMDLPPEPILEAYTKYPDRFVPFYAPDPRVEHPGELLQHYAKKGFKGCGELKVSRKWEDPLVGTYLADMEQLGVALVFHMEGPRYQYIQRREGFLHHVAERIMNDRFNGVSRYYITRFAESTGILKKRIEKNQVLFPGILFDFEGLEKRVAQFPGIRFIGHGPGFWNSISAFQHPRYEHQKGRIQRFGIIDRLLEQYDNFYCDISGYSGYNAMNRHHSQTKRFLQKHVDKVLYGTDNTHLPLLDLLHSMKLGSDQLDKIMFKNALRVLG